MPQSPLPDFFSAFRHASQFLAKFHILPGRVMTKLLPVALKTISRNLRLIWGEWVMWFSTARIRPMIGVASLALACLACPTVANAQERYTPNKPAESQLVIPAADVRVAQAPMPVEMPP